MIAESKVIEEMYKLGLTKKSAKRKGDGIMDTLNISPNILKYFIKINKTKTFKEKFCFDNDLFIETTSKKIYMFSYFSIQTHLCLVNNGIYKLC